MMRSRPTFSHPTGGQLRGARGLLNMSIAELCELTHLAPNTVKRAEATNGPAPITAANAALLVSCLQRYGVVFLPPDDEAGPGVRLSGLEPSGDRVATRRRS